MSRRKEVRIEVDYESDPHTRLKHDFYRRYIACWMAKVLQGKWSKGATIVEPFSGSGQYACGLDGSSVMIAKLYRDHIARKNFSPLVAVTNDLNSQRCDRLNERLAALPPDPQFIHHPVGPERFDQIVEPVSANQAKPGTQVLWLIDPHGLKQIPWKSVKNCAKRKKNDVIVTLMVDDMHRARFNPFMVDTLDTVYGDSSWSSLPEPTSSRESKQQLVDLYCSKLKELGCHVSHFYIDTVKRPARYALIFATHHPAGLTCWNDAKWSSDPNSGSTASLKNEGQLGLFGPDISSLDDHFRTIPGVYKFEELHASAREIGYNEPHVRQALDKLFEEGLALRLEPKVARKTSQWPAESVIRIFEESPEDDLS